MGESKKLVKSGEALTAKQRAFLKAYLDSDSATHFNASASVIAAGYAVTTRYSAGSKLLRHPHIRAIIDAVLGEAGASRDHIIASLAEQVRRPWTEQGGDDIKLRSMHLLGKYLGMEREVSATPVPVVATPVNINLGEQFRELVEEREARLAQGRVWQPAPANPDASGRDAPRPARVV